MNPQIAMNFENTSDLTLHIVYSEISSFVTEQKSTNLWDFEIEINYLLFRAKRDLEE